MAAGRRIIATTAGEALERARALAAQQPMLFRGQTAPWPALATLHRLDADGRAKAREAFARLLDWAEAAPAARALAAEPLAAIAAARHYGLAAPILDLTASPEIALHFALEGAADPGAEAPPQPGVIYAWPRQALAAEPGLRLIDTDGPGVWAGFWRMRAQELVAVHHEDPDARLDLLGEGVAILFPHSPDERAPLTRSERAQPLEASPIERLLEDRAAAASDPGAPAPPSGAPRPAIPAVMFGRATPPLAEGWAEVDPGWTAPPRPEPGAPGETLELAAALREAATAIGLPADLAAGDPAAEPTLAGDLRQAVLAWLGARAGRLRSGAPPRWSVDLPAVSRAARAPLEAALNGFSERMAGAPIDAKRWTAAHASLLTLAAMHGPRSSAWRRSARRPSARKSRSAPPRAGP
ncbi:MAG: FRG domain-containing protein, partial [Pseudomonadota bacterium]